MRLFLDDPLLGDCPSSESDPFPFILRLRDDLEAFLLPTLEPEEDNDLDPNCYYRMQFKYEVNNKSKL